MSIQRNKSSSSEQTDSENEQLPYQQPQAQQAHRESSYFSNPYHTKNKNKKMTKSLYTFFSNNRFGRKLAYVAGPKQSNQSNNCRSQQASESVSRSSSMRDRVIKPHIQERVGKFLDGGIWMIASVVATITSLVAYDFTIAFLPKEVDISTDIILLVVFWFFFIELIVASLVRQGYFLSFWFWLDFIAMISMIPDLTLLLDLFGAGDGEINVANTQASKAGKSGRSAVALKAIRMIRFSRLLRVLRVFKFFQTEDESEIEADPVDAGSSKVGKIVSESVTKKVIVLVLVLVLVLPWMDPSGATYGDAATTAARLFQTCLYDGIKYEDVSSIIADIGVPIIFIKIDNEIHQNNADLIAQRRQVEMWTLDLEDGDSMIFDIRDSVEQEALLGMALTIFAILIFATSTLFVTASTMSLVVQPIARLTELLMRMAGVIGVLGGAQTVENLMEDKDELFIVEALCERIMDIFGGGNQPYPGTNKKSSKALSMMASRKITQITSGDRVWEIDVKEKHRTSVIERRVKRSFVDFVKSEEREVSIEEDAFNELKSLQQIVDNPITLYCLRMFMTSNLTINNLLFILEAEEWKTETRAKFNRIYHKYCDDRSPAQVNLNANMFEEMAQVEKGGDIQDVVFDDAIAETWDIMELNVYNQFLKSDHCKFYVHMKRNDPLTLNQLQLSVPEAPESDIKKHIIRSSEHEFGKDK